MSKPHHPFLVGIWLRVQIFMSVVFSCGPWCCSHQPWITKAFPLFRIYSTFVTFLEQLRFTYEELPRSMVEAVDDGGCFGSLTSGGIGLQFPWWVCNWVVRRSCYNGVEKVKGHDTYEILLTTTPCWFTTDQVAWGRLTLGCWALSICKEKLNCLLHPYMQCRGFLAPYHLLRNTRTMTEKKKSRMSQLEILVSTFPLVRAWRKIFLS